MAYPKIAEALFWCAAAVSAVAQVAVVRAALAGRTPGASTTLASKIREMFWVFLPALILAGVLVWTWNSLPSRVQPVAQPVSRHATHSRTHLVHST